MQDPACKISGACSIESLIQGFSLYNQQHSARSLGKKPLCGEILPDMRKNIHHKKGRGVLHDDGAPSWPCFGGIAWGTALAQLFR
jgi:hypothetical protein